MSVVHAFSSGKADGGDATLVQPSNWNAAHSLTDIELKVSGTQIAVTAPFINGTISVDSFSQAHFINRSATANASTDVVCTANDGSDSTRYIDMGINGSAYSVGTWTINGARDGYVYTQSDNLAIGTATAAKDLVIFTGGTLAANERARFNDNYQSIKNSGLEERLGGVMWVKTSATTLSAFTAAASLIGAVGTGVGTLTLPAGILKVGRQIRLTMRGHYGSTAAAPTLNFLASLGGTTVVTSGAISMTTATMAARPWHMEIDFTCRATGSSATVIGNGIVLGHNTVAVQNSWLMVGTAAVNVNTSVTNAFDITVACSVNAANNNITCNHATLEVIG